MTVQEELDILRANIRVFREREDLSERQRMLGLSQLIDRLLETEPAADPEWIYRRFLQVMPDAASADRALLCHRLAAHPTHGASLSESSVLGSEESPAPGAHGRISLVRNRYNEEALERFSFAVLGAKPSYCPSFSDACEEVYNNRSEFCILPMENTESGRLFGFYSMLDRYELRICGVCDLEAEPGSIRYALIGKTLPKRLPKSVSWNLECSIATEVGAFPTEALQTASVFGALPLKIDSLPVLYDDGLQRFYFTFSVSRGDALAFDLYLSMEHTRYTPIGLYPILK